MHLQESKRVLRQCDLFKDLNEIHLDLILMTCEEISYLAGETIFRQGDVGDALYIVAHGEVDIFLEQEESGEEQHLATMVSNHTFGEVILVEDTRRTASARSKTATHLILLPRDRLLKLCDDYPEIGFHIMYRIAAELARKLQDNNVNIREQLFTKQYVVAENQ